MLCELHDPEKEEDESKVYDHNKHGGGAGDTDNVSLGVGARPNWRQWRRRR